MDRRAILTAGLLGGIGLGADKAIAQDELSGAFKGRVVAGGLDIRTAGETVSITNGTEPFSTHAVFHVKNDGQISCAIRASSYWTGTAERPFNNHDCSLFEVFNKVTSSSLNRSWAGSFANAYNAIPAGVVDEGQRVGVIGWATSVSIPGYEHIGTLTQQIGVLGRAGFQASGSSPSAVTIEAVGVRGVIVNDSVGSTIRSAIAGHFVSKASVGTNERNIAVLASAENGKEENYSFYGTAGIFFNAGQVRVRHDGGQTSASLATRNAGNSVEFGHPDLLGYASTIGATKVHGFPFIAFNAEAHDAGDTFTTRGKAGSVIYGDLAGGIVFARLPEENAKEQNPVESVRIHASGNLCLSANPPKSSSAHGRTGEVAWDENFVYVCIAPNTWKRSALEEW